MYVHLPCFLGIKENTRVSIARDLLRRWSKRPTFQQIPGERWRKTDRSSILPTCLCSRVLPPTSINLVFFFFLSFSLCFLFSFVLLNPSPYPYVSLRLVVYIVRNKPITHMRVLSPISPTLFFSSVLSSSFHLLFLPLQVIS